MQVIFVKIENFLKSSPKKSSVFDKFRKKEYTNSINFSSIGSVYLCKHF